MPCAVSNCLAPIIVLGELIISCRIEIPYDQEVCVARTSIAQKKEFHENEFQREICRGYGLSNFARFNVQARGRDQGRNLRRTLIAAYLELVPEYEGATHNKLVTEFGPSMGTTHNAIPIRLERGESIDVVIMAGPASTN